MASIVNYASSKGGVLFISSRKVSRKPNSLDKKSIKKYMPAKKVIPFKKANINYYGYGSYTNNAKKSPVKKDTSFKVVAPRKKVVKAYKPVPVKKQRVPSSIKPASASKKSGY